MIAVNGRIVAQGSQFSLNDVEVVVATVDIEEVRAHRTKASRNMQAAEAERYQRIEVPFSLSDPDTLKEFDIQRQRALQVRYHTPEEEIAYVFSYTLLMESDHTVIIQFRTSMLDVGLSEEVTYTGILCSLEWGY